MTSRKVRDRLTRFWAEVGPPGVSDTTKRGGEDCRNCNGTGGDPDGDTSAGSIPPCPRCKGTGQEPE